MDDYELRKMPPRVREKYLEIIRNMPPAKKFRVVLEWCDANREMMKAGIRADQPGIGEADLRKELIKRILPPDILKKVYGW